MFGLWLSFFRENCASVAALFVLLPVTLFVNWRLAALLIVLVVAFGLLTSFVLRRTEELQSARRAASLPISPSTRPTRSAMSPVIQSFTRVDERDRARCAASSTRCWPRRLPVLSWWALAAVATALRRR